jgi:hypothetical protein
MEPGLRRELEQPMLLASRLIEHAGLEWISDFTIDDIFGDLYPGREKCQCPRPQCDQTVLRTIVRHHRADWATPELKRSWIIEASEELQRIMPASIQWQLDSDMFKRKGWIGYTLRHPRNGTSLDELDRFARIEEWDHRARVGQRKHRKLTLMVMAELPRRLMSLPRDGEEYMLTAFMTAVTLVHE